MSTQQTAAEVLAAHSGWGQTGPDAHDIMEVTCFNCGAHLGNDGQLIEEWETRTGVPHTDMAIHGAMPAFDDALAAHQADMLAKAGLLASGQCASCSAPIIVDDDDPDNEGMRVCWSCDVEMAKDHREWLRTLPISERYDRALHDAGLSDEIGLGVTREHDAQVAARVLREAADAIVLPGSTAVGYYVSEQWSGYGDAERDAEAWLRTRADRIESGEVAP